MGKLSAFIGLAAVAGIGFYVGKKVYEKKKNEETAHVYDTDSEVFVEEKHSTPKEKLQRASLFAVGALKTGTEKFKEGIDEIINSDMISKGETAMGEVLKAYPRESFYLATKYPGHQIAEQEVGDGGDLRATAEVVADSTTHTDRCFVV